MVNGGYRCRKNTIWFCFLVLVACIYNALWNGDMFMNVLALPLSRNKHPISKIARGNAAACNEECLNMHIQRLERSVARQRFSLSKIYGVKDTADQGLLIQPKGQCNINFYHPPNSQQSAVDRPRVAVSLVVLSRADWLRDAFTTLVASDFFAIADAAIFVWYNQNVSDAKAFMAKQSVPTIIEVPNTTGENEGIVKPRIEIMKAMLEHGCNFQYFLEIHDDMYFFTPWFEQLIKHDKPQYGILMPFVINGAMSMDSAKEFVAKYSANLTENENTVYERCRQVHPWLLKREFVEDVGYYDPVFSPHMGEDDDLYLRGLKAGWIPVAIRSSWAIHWGGLTRGMVLPKQNDYAKHFGAKHGVDVAHLEDIVLNFCHPAIPDAENIRFDAKSAPRRWVPP